MINFPSDPHVYHENGLYMALDKRYSSNSLRFLQRALSEGYFAHHDRHAVRNQVST